MKKRLLAVALSVTMFASMLVGCGSSTETAGNTAGNTDTSTDGAVQEITWMFWDDLNATEDLISKGYKEVVDRFNKDYEGKYHVNVVTTNLEEYYPKLNALVAAGETPDCFIVSPGPNLDVYVDPGVAADLTSYVKADGWIDTFNGGEGAFSQQTYDGKI